MKGFLISLGIILAVASSTWAEPKCHMNEMWSCVKTAINWLHSLPKRSIPESEEDVETMCTAFGDTIDCLLKYRDSCMTPMQKEILQLVVEGALDLRKDFCSSGSATRGKYLSHSTCLNKVSQMDEVKDLIEYIFAVLEKGQNTPNSEFINYACCGYSKVYNSFLKLGRDNCGKDATDALEELLNMGVAQLPEIVCGGYQGDEDKCKAVLPPDGSKPSDNIKGTATYKFLRDTLKNWLD